MAWVKTVGESEAEGELKDVYARVKNERGRVSRIFEVESLDPRSLAAHLDLYLSLMFGAGGLTRPEREMIAVAVSATNHCEYCVAHHSAALLRYVKDSRILKQLRQGQVGEALAPKETGIVSYAIKITRSPEHVTREDIESLKRLGLSDREILQTAMIASYFNFVNRIASGLGVGLEADGGTGYKY
jgi:uncharacterized peroxidase-related enzyme